MNSSHLTSRHPLPFAIEAVVVGCSAEVYLNDIPLARMQHDLGHDRFGMSVNHLVCAGRNTLELLVGGGDRPSTARRAAGAHSTLGMRAELRLVRHAPGAVIGRADPLETLYAGRFEGDGRDAPFPHSLRGECIAQPVFPSWSWEHAERLRLDDRLAREVVEVLAEYRAILLARDLDREREFSQLLHDEVCLAYGSDAAVSRAGLDQVLREEWGRPDWGVDAIEATELDLRLCCDGRLVQCIRPDWDDAIRATPGVDGGRMSVPMMLGRLGGRLRRIR